jgi:hypothetical protein
MKKLLFFFSLAILVVGLASTETVTGQVDAYDLSYDTETLMPDFEYSVDDVDYEKSNFAIPAYEIYNFDVDVDKIVHIDGYRLPVYDSPVIGANDYGGYALNSIQRYKLYQDIQQLRYKRELTDSEIVKALYLGIGQSRPLFVPRE